MWCKGWVEQPFGVICCWICVPFFWFFFNTPDQSLVKVFLFVFLHGLFSDAFTLSCVIKIIQMTGHSFHHHIFEFMLESCGRHGNSYNTLSLTWTPHVFIRLTHTWTQLCYSLTPKTLPLVSPVLDSPFSIFISCNPPFLFHLCVPVCKEAFEGDQMTMIENCSIFQCVLYARDSSLKPVWKSV